MIYLVRVVRLDGKKCWCTFTKDWVAVHELDETEAEVFAKTRQIYVNERMEKLSGVVNYSEINEVRETVLHNPDNFKTMTIKPKTKKRRRK